MARYKDTDLQPPIKSGAKPKKPLADKFMDSVLGSPFKPGTGISRRKKPRPKEEAPELTRKFNDLMAPRRKR